MAIIVPQYPPNFTTANAGTSSKNLIRAGHPVRSAQWTAMAQGVNWLHGQGGTLISFQPYFVNIAAGSSYGFTSYIWPRYENPHRLWVVTIGAGTSNVQLFGTLSNGTDTSDWSLSSSSTEKLTIATLQEEVTPSATPATSNQLVVANDTNSGGNIRVLSVALYELPRTVLDAGYGVDFFALAPRHPIVGSTTGDNHIEAVHRHQRSAKTVARRQMLFNYHYPVGVPESGTSFVDLWASAPEIRARHLENGNTERNVAWTAYTVCASGVTGEIRLTASQSGATDTMSFTNTSAAWQTPRTLSIKTEDPTRWATDTGHRGGTAETVMAAIRNAGGTGNATVLALAIGEST